VALALLSLLLGASTALAAAGDFVTSQAGSLPIVITVPHGGSQAPPNVSLRTTGNTSGDSATDLIAEELVSELESLLGAPPYLVMAEFDRKFIDANRDTDEAFEDPDAAPFYEAYHDKIRSFVDEVRDRFPYGAVLIDLHGQSREPGKICRGTQN